MSAQRYSELPSDFSESVSYESPNPSELDFAPTENEYYAPSMPDDATSSDETADERQHSMLSRPPSRPRRLGLPSKLHRLLFLFEKESFIRTFQVKVSHYGVHHIREFSVTFDARHAGPDCISADVFEQLAPLGAVLDALPGGLSRSEIWVDGEPLGIFGQVDLNWSIDRHIVVGEKKVCEAKFLQSTFLLTNNLPHGDVLIGLDTINANGRLHKSILARFLPWLKSGSKES